MLGRIGQPQLNESLCSQPRQQDRDEVEDMKRAIELLYQFKKELSKLHYNCLDFIEKALQANRY